MNEVKSKKITLKISRSSGTVEPVVVTPADACLDTGFISMGFIDIIVESTTPPVDGILLFSSFFYSKCQIGIYFSLFFPYVFFFLIYSETEEEEDLRYIYKRAKKRGNGYRTDKYSVSLDSFK